MCLLTRIYSLRATTATQVTQRLPEATTATADDSGVRPRIAGGIAIAYLVDLLMLDQNNCFKMARKRYLLDLSAWELHVSIKNKC